MSHAIDPWADPPAELVDPFAPSPRERFKTADMCQAITARLLNSEQDDPPLYPELVQRCLGELKRAADDAVDPALARWARWLLERLHHRAVSGVPYGEPAEPDWSLDPEPRLYERVLSDDGGDLG